jgi:hypothetical protein
LTCHNNDIVNKGDKARELAERTASPFAIFYHLIIWEYFFYIKNKGPNII